MPPPQPSHLRPAAAPQPDFATEEQEEAEEAQAFADEAQLEIESYLSQ